ncbi:reverse transcriptase domain-containing protein [Tanacetum coccineum]
MAERTMEELLRAPTEGYREAIVLPEINADHFEIKTNLLQLVQANPFYGRESENPHAHINSFKRITSTLRFRNVPNDVIKLMMFLHIQLREAAKTWYREKNHLNSNLAWGGFVNKFFTSSKIFTYPSRRDDAEKSRCSKASNQMEKIFQIFQDLRFDISFADALLLMPRFAPTIKSLLMNKEKLLELAKIPLNENCSAMLLKKLPEKLGDPGKFLIPCNFPGMDVCHALADLGASINLMPLSIWKKLSLPELTPTRMTLELADRLITYPKGLAEDVFVKVGKFHFPTDFVVVNFDDQITLWVDNEAVTFNLDQTTRYSSTNDKSINRIDIIDAVFEEYAPELLGFPNSSGGNPTPTSEPFTSEFILEEIEAYLKDDSISPEIDHADCNPEEDICLIEKLLNNDPFQLPPMDLKQSEVTKVKSSIEEPPELELKDLPSHLEYAFLEENDKAIAWKITDIKGIDPRFCTHKILMEDDYKPTVQSQRRVNPKIHEVIKKEVLKLLDAGMIYPISDSPWVSPVHCVPKKGGITVVANEENELIPTRLVTGWRVCIDYRKLNEATRKDHFPLPFMDQMIERLAGNEFYCFLDGFSGYFQIPIDPQDQEKTTFTCPYGTFAYRRMPFGLCNAPGTFQRCMMAIFHDMIEKTMEVFMHDFSVFGDNFDLCLSNLEKILKRCEDTNLVLNWEKCHFMCREGIVLGHKISKSGIEVDRAKVNVIAKLPHPTTVKGVRSFLGHAGFYRRFIQDFSKIARPMTHLLEKETPFVFSKDCIDAFQTLKKKLTEAPILVIPDWNLPFELMCDESDFAIEVQIHYTTTEKEMLAIVYAFKKFRPYLVLSKSIVYTDHSTLKYLMNKQDAKPRLLRWVLLLQEFDITIRDKKGSENLAADHLSRLENPHKDVLENKDINEHFPLETLGVISSESTPWFADYANYHAGNFIIKGMSTQQKRKFFKDVKHYFWDDPYLFPYENSLIYKERTKKLHDSKIKNRIFNVGDRVLLFNSRLKIFSEKLKTRWSGPFTITKVFPYGTIELSQPDGPNFKVNGHRVKHYFRGDLPPKVVQDLHTLSKDE